MRRVKGEENVADLGTTPISKAAISKHSTLEYANMAEMKGEDAQQDVAMFCDGSGPDARDGWAGRAACRTQSGDRAKRQQRQHCATFARWTPWTKNALHQIHPRQDQFEVNDQEFFMKWVASLFDAQIQWMNFGRSCELDDADVQQPRSSTEKLKSMSKAVDVSREIKKTKLEVMKAEFDPLTKLMREVPSDIVGATQVDVA